MNPAPITPNAPANSADILQNDFNRMVEAYNQLWLLRSYEMPDELVTEAFTELISSMDIMMRGITTQQETHIRDARIRARIERARAVEPAPVPAPTVVVVPEPTPMVIPVAAQAPEPAPTQVVVTTPVPAPAPMHAPTVARPRVVSPNTNTVRHRDTTAAVNRQREINRNKPFRRFNIGCLTKKEQVSKMPEPCCICMDEYTMMDSFTTNCHHSFCKTCFDQHERTGLAKLNPRVDCPMCRTQVRSVCSYRARKTPVRRPKQVVETPAIVHTPIESEVIIV